MALNLRRRVQFTISNDGVELNIPPPNRAGCIANDHVQIALQQIVLLHIGLNSLVRSPLLLLRSRRFRFAVHRQIVDVCTERVASEMSCRYQ